MLMILLMIFIGVAILLSFLLLFIIWIHTAPLKHGKEEAIVILGYRCDRDEINPLLLDRLNTAIKLIRTHAYKKIIVSGGNVSQTSSITEAEIMRDYLIKNGIKDDDLLMELESRDTIENLINCEHIMKRENIHSFLVVSNSFHIRRIQMIAQALKLKPAFYASRNIHLLASQLIRTLNEAKLFLFTYLELRRRRVG